MLVVLSAGVIGGCSSMKANVDVADDADFSQYKTFAQAPPPKADENLPGYTEIEGQRLQDEIARILEARGFKKVDDPKTADFFVSFSLTGQPRADVWGTGGIGWGYYGGTGAGISTTHYIHANLTINMYDAADRKLVWHGWTTKDFFAGEGDSDGAAKAVQLILGTFPPGTDAM